MREAAVSVLRQPGTFVFLLALPFSYYPKVIGGDTQPWPLLAVLALFLLSRTAKRWDALDGAVLATTAAAILAYLARVGLTEDFLRFSYKLVSFALLFVCASALPVAVVAKAMRWTIAIWFVVGLTQTAFVMLGIDLTLPGRFVAGRSGVPSLAPEPSLYGLLSVVALYYLLMSGQRVHMAYVLMALGNVFLSGSILAVMAVAFLPLMFRVRMWVVVIALVVPALVAVLSLADLAFLNRLTSYLQSDAGLGRLLLDYSTNLRIGHVVYTLWHALPESLVFRAPIGFEDAYNQWAFESGIFFPTGSDFILTGLGDVIFRGGVFGAVLVLLVFLKMATLPGGRFWLRSAILVTLLLTQLGLSNTFFILYALQRSEK